MLQRKKTLLIPLWCQDQDVHEPPTWFTLTLETFDAWREKRAEMFESKQASLDNETKTWAVGCFMKEARRSVADHSKFKEAKRWQQWVRHLQSTASAQGVDDVFNPSCVSLTDEEKALFVEQQKFGCQVLEQTTQTPEGMGIVCEHSQTKNAQSVWAKLQDRCAHSQGATLA
jgi:hypothetical protein